METDYVPANGVNAAILMASVAVVKASAESSHVRQENAYAQPLTTSLFSGLWAIPQRGRAAVRKDTHAMWCMGTAATRMGDVDHYQRIVVKDGM